MSYFNCCLKCQRTFTSEKEYDKHIENHRSGVKSKAVEKPEFTIQANEPAVTENFSEENADAIKAANQETTRMRKKLIQMGIEAQTMSPAQVKYRYEEEMAKIQETKGAK